MTYTTELTDESGEHTDESDFSGTPCKEHFIRRRIWANKPQIRLVYQRWTKLMVSYLPSGTILEVGSGSGLLKNFWPDVILSDVIKLPWIDRIIDCMKMPFGEGELGGIVSFDLLHHVANPHEFLEESARVLKPGGRILLMEPYITPVSHIFYKMLHFEDINFKVYHEGLCNQQGKSDPWQGNLAMANIVFDRELSQWGRLHPNLKILKKQKLSFLDFQFAAGFRDHAYLPHGLFKHLVKIDDYLGWLMGLIGFRVFVVLEKI